jgi:hypothetical protein
MRATVMMWSLVKLHLVHLVWSLVKLLLLRVLMQMVGVLSGVHGLHLNDGRLVGEVHEPSLMERGVHHITWRSGSVVGIM